jgi:hypothetical protein
MKISIEKIRPDIIEIETPVIFSSKYKLDKFIKEFNSDLKIKRHSKGYYYFYSKDEKLALHLASLETSSVLVFNQNQLTINQWKHEILNVLEGF